MGFYILISVLILIVCVLMTLVVLVQNSKGGGLASNFASSNQFMGVRKTADFLEKATWTLAVSLLILSLFSILIIPKPEAKGSADTRKSEMQEKIDNAKAPAPVKDFQAPPEQKK